MELNELEVFQAVAAEHSFSRAATRLHRTQPAVSQSIRRLEDELDERLFDRSSKGGQLTEAGQILLNYAQRLIPVDLELALEVQVRGRQKDMDARVHRSC